MGNLSVVQIYHDCGDEIKNNPLQFTEQLYSAISHGKGEVILGQTTVKPCQHADNPTTYVLIGNCLSEMNPDSEETQKSLRVNPGFYKEKLKFLETQVKGLRKLLEDNKKY